MDNLFKLKNIKTRSISPENFTGEKGKGGMATEGANAYNARELGQGWKVSPCVRIPAGETFVMADVKDMGIINHIWCTDSSDGNRDSILRIYWDGSEIPSVEVPLGDFFASADSREFRQLTSAAVCINPAKGYNCYWQMPFKTGFKFTIENLMDKELTIYYQIDYQLTEVDDTMGYFHAQFRRVNPLPYKEVYTILDNVKGKGQYIGTYMFWGVNNCRWWGEGEIKFYLDGDTDFPTICGTGTEDYFCGSWDFSVDNKYREFCTPYVGMPKVITPDGHYNSQQRFSMYRWHIVDPIYFDEDIKVTIQALGWRSGGRYLPLQDDISSVAYWYMDSICDTFPQLPSKDYLEII